MVNDPVQMCMIAYAFNLMGHYAKDATFLRAHDMRREGTTGRLSIFLQYSQHQLQIVMVETLQIPRLTNILLSLVRLLLKKVLLKDFQFHFALS